MHCAPLAQERGTVHAAQGSALAKGESGENSKESTRLPVIVDTITDTAATNAVLAWQLWRDSERVVEVFLTVT